MKHALVGIGGTVATVDLASWDHRFAILAGALTSAWMIRCLWLSFQKKS